MSINWPAYFMRLVPPSGLRYEKTPGAHGFYGE
jgi:hypothetical protein